MKLELVRSYFQRALEAANEFNVTVQFRTRQKLYSATNNRIVLSHPDEL